jgi:molecular chaperone DnaK (HSP70)
MLQLNNIDLPASVDGSLPTAIAFPTDNGSILFGEAALQSERRSYNLLVNWKLLLSMTPLQLNKERLEHPSFEQILSKYSLDDICIIYFRHILQEATKCIEFEDRPQLIIGTPTSSESASAAARSRYMRRIEAAFQKLGLPKPRFFPEPFAVFQYLWSNGEIPDIGGPQNVFILDIGGGTTNACTI